MIAASNPFNEILVLVLPWMLIISGILALLAFTVLGAEKLGETGFTFRVGHAFVEFVTPAVRKVSYLLGAPARWASVIGVVTGIAYAVHDFASPADGYLWFVLDVIFWPLAILWLIGYYGQAVEAARAQSRASTGVVDATWTRKVSGIFWWLTLALWRLLSFTETSDLYAVAAAAIEAFCVAAVFIDAPGDTLGAKVKRWFTEPINTTPIPA